MSPISQAIWFLLRARTIEVVVLRWWHDFPPHGAPYEVLESFAGVAWIATLARHVGYRTAAVDIEFGKGIKLNKRSRPPMNRNSDAGLLHLGLF